MKEKENYFNKFKSPMPPHLTLEEKEKWLKEVEWQNQEFNRRKKEGFYSDDKSDNMVSKIIKKFSYKANKKKEDDTGYGLYL